MNVTEITGCRVCEDSEFTDLLDFGEQDIVCFPLPGGETRGKAPLRMVICMGCGLVQLKHTVEADTLYKEFWYRSGINEQMKAALLDVVHQASRQVTLKVGDYVCDIGSNDGTLLSYYSPLVYRVGFEPAIELAKESVEALANLKKAAIVPHYFNAEEALNITGENKFYKIITAIAMFYDLDDPKFFLRNVMACLAMDGVFVVQMNYLGTMIKNNTFDNISHEHLCYYSLTTLKKLFDEVGLKIYDVERNDVNGGSFRVYACRADGAPREVRPSVANLLEEEELSLTLGALEDFGFEVERTCSKLYQYLVSLKADGKKLFVYGASTRGLTLLQKIFKPFYQYQAYHLFNGVADRDPRKFGREMAGTGLQIVSEEWARKSADYFFVLCYHFWDSILKRERPWMLGGGRLIAPLPRAKVVVLEELQENHFVPVAQDIQPWMGDAITSHHKEIEKAELQ